MLPSIQLVAEFSLRQNLNTYSQSLLKISQAAPFESVLEGLENVSKPTLNRYLASTSTCAMSVIN